jgi:hypothetical protein
MDWYKTNRALAGLISRPLSMEGRGEETGMVAPPIAELR